MKDKLSNYVRAGYSGLYIVSHEELRVEKELKAVTDATKFSLWAWSVTSGIQKIDDTVKEIQTIADSQDPFAMLTAFEGLEEKSVLLLRDFHMWFAEPNPIIFRKLKDSLMLAKAHNRVIVIIGCLLKLPPELEKEITVLEFSLPDRTQLREVLESVADSGSVKLPKNVELILDAASGLTTTEAENAFALAVVEAKDITPEIVQREKALTVRKNGLLEIVSNKVGVDQIGGLENLKRDLLEKRNLFTQEARDYGLPSPRGVLAVGQAGSGKSLTATATASIFNIPLLRLEAGKLFGSLVGQSEGNWRAAFATAKAIAPCVFWIDEVDGLFSGAESSGQTDGGTTNRVIKAILQDMQMNGEGIFFFFTANDIDGLPDPLIDRLDVWSVDLPNATEREAIWKIHIEKRGRKSKGYDLADLSKITDGFSGRQIEQVWLKAMTLSFNAKREPKESDVLEVAKRVVATSITMKEAIEKRRARLQNRATPASAPEAKASTARKIAK
ncbi:MAG: family ATPase [Verrucomicrobiales bacterium]|nr:family ATPase [Verrucomicrobiales bacterium]